MSAMDVSDHDERSETSSDDGDDYSSSYASSKSFQCTRCYVDKRFNEMNEVCDYCGSGICNFCDYIGRGLSMEGTSCVVCNQFFCCGCRDEKLWRCAGCQSVDECLSQRVCNECIDQHIEDQDAVHCFLCIKEFCLSPYCVEPIRCRCCETTAEASIIDAANECDRQPTIDLRGDFFICNGDCKSIVRREFRRIHGMSDDSSHFENPDDALTQQHPRRRAAALSDTLGDDPWWAEILSFCDAPSLMVARMVSKPFQAQFWALAHTMALRVRHQLCRRDTTPSSSSS